MSIRIQWHICNNWFHRLLLCFPKIYMEKGWLVANKKNYYISDISTRDYKCCVWIIYFEIAIYRLCYLLMHTLFFFVNAYLEIYFFKPNLFRKEMIMIDKIPFQIPRLIMNNIWRNIVSKTRVCWSALFAQSPLTLLKICVTFLRERSILAGGSLQAKMYMVYYLVCYATYFI